MEDEPRSGRTCKSKTDENVTKVRAVVRYDRSLTVRMISTIARSLNDSEKGFITPGQRLRTLGCCITTTPLSHRHLRERIIDQKGYSSGSAAPILAWSESVWFLPFPETQIPPQSSSFCNYGWCPKGRDRPAESTSTWRLAALLLGVVATSSAVCGGFPRELRWRG